MRDFNKDLEQVHTFSIEYNIGFGAEDKDDDDESRYTIAYEVDDNTLFLYLTEDETEETDQVIIDTIILKVYEDIDLVAVLHDKCKAHGIIIDK
jgi:hypothetical protein